MKTPYLNELIEKLTLYKRNDDLNDLGKDGLKELLKVKEVIDFAHSYMLLNNTFKNNDEVMYLGVKMKINFIDLIEQTANLYCSCDKTYFKEIALKKLTEIV